MNDPILNTKQKGYTILEIFIAMTILSIGILALVKMQVESTRGNATAVNSTEGNLAAQCHIETLFNASYESINNDNASTGDGYTVVTNADNAVIPTGYTLEWRVTQETDLSAPADGINDLKEIHVRVKDSEDKTRSDLTFTKARML
jgi:prepilin-type N-terminal cleavage/methylation domain-containing protein